MIHALPRLSRILFASALVLVPPAAPALAAGAPQQTAVPEPICIPWIICHIKLPGRLTVNDGGQGQKDIELLSWSWGASGAARPPMRASSDPEEGGEIAARTVQKPARPSVSELTVSKKTDVASPTLLRSANGGAAGPGKVEYPNVQASAGPSEPPPSGTLTIVVARGSCASGKHLPEVKLSSRGRTYTLHDVDVTACADSGQNTDTCTLSYGSVAG
jgi:type VI protein secretion system component Hcp